MTEEMMKIGKITRHQGNKGEVRVAPLTDYPERFKRLKTVFLAAGRDKKELTIEQVRYHKGFVILKFVGFDSIEQAIEHKGYIVKIPESKAVDLPEDTYFMHQILDLKVFTKQNKYLGTVEEIIETPANDVYRVVNGDQEILIPALREVVREVNLEEEILLVELIRGLE